MENIDYRIEIKLMDLGFKPHLSGFIILKDVIKTAVNYTDSELMNFQIIKLLEKVAKMHNVSDTAVYRNVRTLINKNKNYKGKGVKEVICYICYLIREDMNVIGAKKD